MVFIKLYSLVKSICNILNISVLTTSYQSLTTSYQGLWISLFDQSCFNNCSSMVGNLPAILQGWLHCPVRLVSSFLSNGDPPVY